MNEKKLEFKNIRKRVFRPIKHLDAEIRFIKNEQSSDKSIFWMVDIGLCESMGELGYIHTLFFDAEPTEKEIIEGIRDHIKEQIKGFATFGGLREYEKQQLKILRGVSSE